MIAPIADERVERAQRRRLAHLGMRAAVRELLELHGELDVGERAAAELEVELRILAGRDALALDARLHAPHLAPPLLGERVAVHERVRERRRSARRARRRRRRTRALVSAWNSHVCAHCSKYVAVAAERSRERALVAFGPQPRVDAERSALRRAVADRADESRRDALGGREVGGGRAVVHEDHVDVGRVRQLGAAEPAEPDHRERQRRFERAQRGFDARVGEARELAAGGVERREAEHVARADAQQLRGA